MSHSSRRLSMSWTEGLLKFYLKENRVPAKQVMNKNAVTIAQIVGCTEIRCIKYGVFSPPGFTSQLLCGSRLQWSTLEWCSFNKPLSVCACFDLGVDFSPSCPRSISRRATITPQPVSQSGRRVLLPLCSTYLFLINNNSFTLPILDTLHLCSSRKCIYIYNVYIYMYYTCTC